MLEIGTFAKCTRQSRFTQIARKFIFKVVARIPCKKAKCVWGGKVGAKKKICFKCDGYIYRGKKIKETVGTINLRLRNTPNLKPFNVALAGFDMKALSEEEVTFELL